MAGTIAILEDSQFESEVLKATQPVLVDFYTDWCPPCKAMAPVLEALSTELAATLKIVKVECEKAPQTARLNRIEAYPTFILFRSGKPIAMARGAQAKKPFQQWIETALARP